MKVRLWFVEETEKAVHYSRVPLEKTTEATMVWIPKSVIEGKLKFGDCHQVELPEWIIEEKDL